MECGTTKKLAEVRRSCIKWTAWGGNAFDFNWQRRRTRIDLCRDCEDNLWVNCSTCGALVDINYYGTGYPEDYDGEFICPGCLEKQGIKLTVPVYLK